MSTRHYLKIINKETECIELDIQILGNHDYFNKEVYENLGVELNDDGECYTYDEVEEEYLGVEINLIDLIFEWRKWLDKQERKHGIYIPFRIIEMKNLKEQKRAVYLDTLWGEYYVLEPFLLLNHLRENDYLNIYDPEIAFASLEFGNLKKEYKATLEIH